MSSNNIIRMATEQEVKYFSQNDKNFKNLIINGDFRIAQRETNVISSGQDFIIDRFQTQTNGSIIVGRDAIILPGSVSLVDNVDPFGDGSGVALWKLDGNANDAGGRYNGTWTGTEQYDTGIFGQAAKFDGHSYIDTGLGMLNFIKNGGTFSLWIKADPKNNNKFIEFFGYRSENTIASFSLLWYNIYDYLDIVNSGSNADYRNIKYKGINHLIKTGVHITVTFDGNGKYYGYINGQYIGEQNLSNNDSNTNYNILIGWSGSNSKLNGLIDQVRIFNRPLTDEEVQKLFYEESKVIRKLYTVTLKTINKPSNYTNQTIKHLIYRFEGQHLYHLVAEGKKATLSFEMTAKKPGKYAVALINKTTSNYETLLKTFNYNGNQNEKISITFDFSKFQNEVRNNENLGFELVICGYTQKSNLVGNEGYNTGEKICSSDCVEINNNDSISISKLQLEEGEIATEFEYVPYETQLQRCMRYYEKLAGIFPAYANGAHEIVCFISMEPKRTLPTIKTDFSKVNREPGDQNDLTGINTLYRLSISNSSSLTINLRCSTNLTPGNSAHCSAVEFPSLILDAEL